MKFFLFVVSFFLLVKCSNNKSELIISTKNKKDDIETKKNSEILSVYQFSKNAKIDSTINKLQNFKNFRKSIESIFIRGFVSILIFYNHMLFFVISFSYQIGNFDKIEDM